MSLQRDGMSIELTHEGLAQTAMLDQIRMLHSKLDRLTAVLEATFDRNHELTYEGVWKVRKRKALCNKK